jgi:hypothetical protein
MQATATAVARVLLRIGERIVINLPTGVTTLPVNADAATS